jgi:hypothetical protein
MPYKARKRRRSFRDYDLESRQKQSFCEWWILRCGHWDDAGDIINSREVMVNWYQANRDVFDRPATDAGLSKIGHGPGERHTGWWYTIGFPEYGPRLVVDPEAVEQHFKNQLYRRHVPRPSFHKNSDRLIENWKAGRMPTEGELRKHNSWTIPNRLFPDGLESDQEYLERHNQIIEEEQNLLFEASVA